MPTADNYYSVAGESPGLAETGGQAMGHSSGQLWGPLQRYCSEYQQCTATQKVPHFFSSFSLCNQLALTFLPHFQLVFPSPIKDVSELK